MSWFKRLFKARPEPEPAPESPYLGVDWAKEPPPRHRTRNDQLQVEYLAYARQQGKSYEQAREIARRVVTAQSTAVAQSEEQLLELAKHMIRQERAAGVGIKPHTDALDAIRYAHETMADLQRKQREYEELANTDVYAQWMRQNMQESPPACWPGMTIRAGAHPGATYQKEILRVPSRGTSRVYTVQLELGALLLEFELGPGHKGHEFGYPNLTVRVCQRGSLDDPLAYNRAPKAILFEGALGSPRQMEPGRLAFAKDTLEYATGEAHNLTPSTPDDPFYFEDVKAEPTVEPSEQGVA